LKVCSLELKSSAFCGCSGLGVFGFGVPEGLRLVLVEYRLTGSEAQSTPYTPPRAVAPVGSPSAGRRVARGGDPAASHTALGSIQGRQARRRSKP